MGRAGGRRTAGVGAEARVVAGAAGGLTLVEGLADGPEAAGVEPPSEAAAAVDEAPPVRGVDAAAPAEAAARFTPDEGAPRRAGSGARETDRGFAAVAAGFAAGFDALAMDPVVRARAGRRAAAAGVVVHGLTGVCLAAGVTATAAGPAGGSAPAAGSVTAGSVTAAGSATASATATGRSTAGAVSTVGIGSGRSIAARGRASSVNCARYSVNSAWASATPVIAAASCRRRFSTLLWASVTAFS